MTRYTISGATGEQLASRMIYLAWQRAGVSGYGFLQDQGEQSEAAVWFAVLEKHDYPGAQPTKNGEAEADYVFGRMMKVYLRFGADWVSTNNPGPYRGDYQSFARTFCDFGSLVKAAAESLGATAAIAAEQIKKATA